MTLPTIHRNGTHAADLLEDLCTVYGALGDALASLRNVGCPNARDYYPQGSGAFQSAVAEHESRIGRLESVRAEIDALREHISDAMTTRETR